MAFRFNKKRPEGRGVLDLRFFTHRIFTGSLLDKILLGPVCADSDLGGVVATTKDAVHHPKSGTRDRV